MHKLYYNDFNTKLLNVPRQLGKDQRISIIYYATKSGCDNFLSVKNIYSVTNKSNDAYVKRQGYKLAFFGGGEGYLCCGNIFQKYNSTQRFAGKNV